MADPVSVSGRPADSSCRGRGSELDAAFLSDSADADQGAAPAMRSSPVLGRAVEEGVAYGWRCAHKHIDTPDSEAIEEQIVCAVLNEVCESFDFDEHEEV